MSQVHLVVPCYRESARIGSFLPDLCALMDSLGGITVQVVEDGSGPEEQSKMRALITRWRGEYACLQEPLFLLENLGKGGAVYAGWSQAAEDVEWLGFVDADGACPASETKRLIQMTRSGDHDTQALFASRVKMLGRDVRRLLKRHLLGRIYATLVSELLDIPIYDSQCGLKLVSKKAYASIASSLKIQGFAFDVELLVKLLDSQCRVIEVPIDWQEIPGGKVRLVHDAIAMSKDVWSIRQHRRQES